MAWFANLLLAYDSWRTKNFVVELVILNEHPTGYSDAVQDQLQRLLGESTAWSMLNKRGGVFILPGGRVPEEDRILLQAAARVVLNGNDGSLEKQLETAVAPDDLLAIFAPSRPAEVNSAATKLPAARVLGTEPAAKQDSQFSNGFGAFAADCKEYRIELTGDRRTPAPWSNVIANARFGCVVTDAGLGSTWGENSREFRLTSWSNDPISDPPSEAVYLRDEETGEVWSPTPLPIRESSAYAICHGQGYSRYEHASHGIDQQLLVTLADSDPLKIVRLTLRNDSIRSRTLSVTYCVEWVLGVAREQTQLHVLTEIDLSTGGSARQQSFQSGICRPNRLLATHWIASEPTPPTVASSSDETAVGIDLPRSNGSNFPAASDQVATRAGRCKPNCGSHRESRARSCFS